MDVVPGVSVGDYLDRIGFGGEPSVDLESLARLMRDHLTAVPFENLDVVAGGGERTGSEWSVAKIVEDRRGGWCYELNGAFGALLEAIGFPVLYLGAAVLLDGPSDVVDHLALEVMLEEPWLVDVGFGDTFFQPLALNRRGPQPGGNGDYEFLPSPKGTTLAAVVDGVPEAKYRFKRVGLKLADFEASAEKLRSDPTLSWSKKSFATRLLEGGPDRVTLRDGVLKLNREGETTETPVAASDWDDQLRTWFGLSPR